MPSDHTVPPLSDDEREAGIQSYLKHAWWNGLGINLLNTNMISLVAIGFGATNLQLGYISSAFHFAGIVLVLLPKLLHGANIRTVFFTAWLLRGMVCFLYALLFFLEGQTAVVVIMVVYTMFAMLRSAGIPMHHPLQRNLVPSAEIGRFISRLHVRLSISQLASQIASFVFLTLQTGVATVGIIWIPLIGAGCNTCAAYYISKIPSNETVEYRTGKNIFVLFAETMRDAERARTVIAYWLALSSMIVFAFSIAFLRREVNMPTNMVFLHTIALALAAIIASSFARPFADRMGSRPLLLLSSGFFALTSLGWALLPTDLPWVMYYIIGFGGYFFLRLKLQLVSRLIVRALPEQDRVAYTSMMYFVAAVLALGIGLVGGWLADVGMRLSFLPHQYTLTFVLLMLMAAASGLVSYGLVDRGSMSLRNTAAIFLSPRNLKDFLTG